MANYDYDDIGWVKTKHLDPNYNNANSGLPDLEALNYSFNIHNQITGINKDYALKTSGSYNKWGISLACGLASITAIMSLPPPA